MKYFSIVYVRLKCMLTFSLNKKNLQDEANTKDNDEAKKNIKYRIKIESLFTIYKDMHTLPSQMFGPFFEDAFEAILHVFYIEHRNTGVWKKLYYSCFAPLFIP